MVTCLLLTNIKSEYISPRMEVNQEKKKGLYIKTEQGKEQHLEEQHSSKNEPLLDLEKKKSRKLLGIIGRMISVIQLQKNRLR